MAIMEKIKVERKSHKSQTILQKKPTMQIKHTRVLELNDEEEIFLASPLTPRREIG